MMGPPGSGADDREGLFSIRLLSVMGVSNRTMLAVTNGIDRRLVIYIHKLENCSLSLRRTSDLQRADGR